MIATERLLEDEMFRLVPKSVGIHFSRTLNAREIDVAGLASMSGYLAGAGARILPGETPDVAQDVPRSEVAAGGEVFVP